MGTPLGPKYIPYTYMNPLGKKKFGFRECAAYMSHSLNSLKGDYMGEYIGDYYRGY